VITFLLSKQASFMNGTVFRVDRGQFRQSGTDRSASTGQP
jgi:hypothetical protein